MKFSSNEDVEAPIETVFGMYSDFDMFERAALRRGAEIVRTDKLKAPGAGMAWKASFKFRGRPRLVTGEIVTYDPPEGYVIEAISPNLIGVMSVDLVPLSRNRTRVSLALEIKPKSLTGRLMVQSLKLGKTRITRRFKVAAADYAKSLEDRIASGDTA